MNEPAVAPSAASPAAPPTHFGCPQPRPDWVPPDAGPEFATWLVEGVRPVGPAPPSTAPPVARPPLDLDRLVAGVFAGERAVLGRALTLVESNAPAHQALAQQLLSRLAPRIGRARRIGITGVPGAGKSTFIETLGTALIQQGHRVAVLAVDPSSSISGGSILGDKTRMERLGRAAEAFIRPSPSGGSLGGVARKTREAILVCEAAGYDVVLVETVGVGQNEVAVHAMVDFFLVLLIAGAGDELQGMKKGVIELADALVVNKADGENRPRALATCAELQRVLLYLQPSTPGWKPPALTTSARTGDGVPEVWGVIDAFYQSLRASRELERRRCRQAVGWMHALIAEQLRAQFYATPAVRASLATLERGVAAGDTTPLAAAWELLQRGQAG